MWIVKLGGSLNTDPRLPEWLELLVQLGGGRVTVVCGGGVFADEVRRVAGALALRRPGGAQHGRAGDGADRLPGARALNPKLHLAASKADIRDVLRSGHTALWLPLRAAARTA